MPNEYIKTPGNSLPEFGVCQQIGHRPQVDAGSRTGYRCSICSGEVRAPRRRSPRFGKRRDV